MSSKGGHSEDTGIATNCDAGLPHRRGRTFTLKLQRRIEEIINARISNDIEEKLEAFITQPVKKHRKLRREATGEDKSTFPFVEVLTPFDEQGMFEQKAKRVPLVTWLP